MLKFGGLNIHCVYIGIVEYSLHRAQKAEASGKINLYFDNLHTLLPETIRCSWCTNKQFLVSDEFAWLNSKHNRFPGRTSSGKGVGLLLVFLFIFGECTVLRNYGVVRNCVNRWKLVILLFLSEFQ